MCNIKQNLITHSSGNIKIPVQAEKKLHRDLSYFMGPEWGNAQQWEDFSSQCNSIQYNFIFCATNVPVSEWIYCSSLNFWLAFHHSLSITHLLHNNTCVWMGVCSCSDLSLGSAFIDRKNSLKCKTCPWTHFVLYSYCTAFGTTDFFILQQNLYCAKTMNPHPDHKTSAQASV